VGTFRFKQFSVNDDDATMKVGTDAVLLGAWCAVDTAGTILDIGAGSGVIALMLAQRSVSGARIDAVEVDQQASRQAEENVRQSPWPEKITVINTPIQAFEPGRVYDLIVSNPPFFSGSLHPPNDRRMVARHDTELTKQDLVVSVSRLLNKSGTFSVILPNPEYESFRAQALSAGLHLTRVTRFHTRLNKSPERVLMTFSRAPVASFPEDMLVLYDSESNKSKAYRNLTDDFYL